MGITTVAPALCTALHGPVRGAGALVWSGVTMAPLRHLAAAGLRILAAHVDGEGLVHRPALMAYPDPGTDTYHVVVFTAFGKVCANLPMS